MDGVRIQKDKEAILKESGKGGMFLDVLAALDVKQPCNWQAERAQELPTDYLQRLCQAWAALGLAYRPGVSSRLGVRVVSKEQVIAKPVDFNLRGATTLDHATDWFLAQGWKDLTLMAPPSGKCTTIEECRLCMRKQAHVHTSSCDALEISDLKVPTPPE